MTGRVSTVDRRTALHAPDPCWVAVPGPLAAGVEGAVPPTGEDTVSVLRNRIPHRDFRVAEPVTTNIWGWGITWGSS